MAGLEHGEAVAAIDEACRGVTGLLGNPDEPDFPRPTRCLGRTVADCLYHLLGEVRATQR